MTKDKSRYWIVSSAELGDIGIDMLVKSDMNQVLDYYQTETLDFTEDIDIYPVSKYDLYASELDIL